MTSQAEIGARFWAALRKDRTIMLGLEGAAGADVQPMTVLVEEKDGEGGPLWIFSASDTDLVRSLGESARAVAAFASKGHDLFASLHGTLTVDNDRRTIDRLWNPYVAAWFEGGKDDPRLALLRFDPESAKIWLNATTFEAATQWLFGRDPKAEYQDKVAEVSL
ncbi:MAG: pyridoxamine 5'-phosphate oxidase family protein [Sphingomonadaceae bacterium]|nr:pyridoxamine 5'-phosphate oxidase family protein [Sphingomonadaceae bacterium]